MLKLFINLLFVKDGRLTVCGGFVPLANFVQRLPACPHSQRATAGAKVVIRRLKPVVNEGKLMLERVCGEGKFAL